jgi:hypothetical protein
LVALAIAVRPAPTKMTHVVIDIKFQALLSGIPHPDLSANAVHGAREIQCLSVRDYLALYRATAEAVVYVSHLVPETFTLDGRLPAFDARR